MIGDFIVDLLAPSAHLIVELDGAEHRLKPRADAFRDRKLARAWYRVLRFANRDVGRRLDWVVAAVRAAVVG